MQLWVRVQIIKSDVESGMLAIIGEVITNGDGEVRASVRR